MNTDSGSLTVAPSPKPARKSESAIGVTYSCEKRTSVRTKSASPGFTKGTPTRPSRASTIACAAMIFSTIVMGRAPVSIAGGATSPRSRSLLYSKSPPARTMSALMRSSPSVNSRIGMASPRTIRGIRPKSVLVSRPMFCEFCP